MPLIDSEPFGHGFSSFQVLDYGEGGCVECVTSFINGPLFSFQVLDYGEGGCVECTKPVYQQGRR